MVQVSIDAADGEASMTVILVALSEVSRWILLRLGVHALSNDPFALS